MGLELNGPNIIFSEKKSEVSKPNQSLRAQPSQILMVETKGSKPLLLGQSILAIKKCKGLSPR
jgi:hypothetical protein